MIFKFADHELDTTLHELRRDGTICAIEPQVFDLLHYLIKHRDRLVTKDELLEAVWTDRVVTDWALSSRIMSARKAVGDDGNTQAVIRTVPRRGFRFVASVEAQQKPPGPQYELRPEVDASFEAQDLLPLPSKPSIAVLPFDNMTSDPEQEYFADGMTEGIITLLSADPDLFVIARSSSFVYKGRSTEAQKISEELGVRYLLKGSVRRAGCGIRVTVQFIDISTGNHIWSDSFDRSLDDIFTVQDEVARGIVAALQSRLLTAEAEYMDRRPQASLDAWGNMIKARLSMFAYRPQDIEQAEPFARAALEIQPDNAPAQAVLAQILAWRSYNGWTDDLIGAAQEAIGLAKRALGNDGNNPTILTDIAFAYVWLGLFTKSAQLAERAIELNPNSALSSAIAGHAFAIVGRTEEGVKLIRQAFCLSPNDPFVHIFHMYECSIQYFAGDMAACRRSAEKVRNHRPDICYPYILHAAALAQDGQTEAARDHLHKVVEMGFEDAIGNLFRPLTAGTHWRQLTDVIKDIYDGELPVQPD